MPRKHPKDKRIEALELLSYGQSVSTVHFATGIPMRTLYNWKARFKRKQERQMARKTSETATNPPHIPDSRHKTADSCQSAADSRLNHAPSEQQLPHTRNSGSAKPESEDKPTNTDVEDLTYIREQLMKYAREMAADLRPNEPDSNRRTLALARILDRIQWLDQILPDRIPEQTIRHVFFYDGEEHEHPPWHGATQKEDA